MTHARAERVDVTVIGAGLVGLTASLALADRGLRVALVDDGRPGQASRASGGALAPSVDPAAGVAGTFARAALARYPSFLDALHERSGHRVALGRGVLQVAADEGAADRLRRELLVTGGGARWLDAADVAALEPALRAPMGAALHPDDGWVDPPALLAALGEAVGRTAAIRVHRARAVELRARDSLVRVTLADGARLASTRAVVAAGAWAPTLAGVRPLAVEPLRGEMIALAGRAVEHVVFGAGGYLVPRADGTHVGATSERVGFDPATTADGALALDRVAAALCPSHPRRVTGQWAGIRPMTPDGQPILDRELERPAVVHACGFSRNGVLLAPLAAECVAALAAGEPPLHDLSAFRARRFD